MYKRTKEQRHAEYLRTKDKCLARAKKWADNNPDKRQQILKKWNAKATDYKRLWAQQKNFGGVVELVECQRCGSEDKLVVHHQDGNNGKMGKPMNNSPDNLIVLCRRCHPKLHYRGEIRVLTK